MTPANSNQKLPIDENAFPKWRDSFDGDTKRKLIDADLDAGQSVTRLLVAIVTGGLLLGMLGVVLSMSVKFNR